MTSPESLVDARATTPVSGGAPMIEPIPSAAMVALTAAAEAMRHAETFAQARWETDAGRAAYGWMVPAGAERPWRATMQPHQITCINALEELGLYQYAPLGVRP